MSRKPSKELVRSTTIGGGLGGAIELGAFLLGHPLPPGAGAAVAGMLTGAVHWFQKRGRAPDPQPPEIP